MRAPIQDLLAQRGLLTPAPLKPPSQRATATSAGCIERSVGSRGTGQIHIMCTQSTSTASCTAPKLKMTCCFYLSVPCKWRVSSGTVAMCACTLCPPPLPPPPTAPPAASPPAARWQGNIASMRIRPANVGRFYTAAHARAPSQQQPLQCSGAQLRN